jgi:hypothetical protein
MLLIRQLLMPAHHVEATPLTSIESKTWAGWREELGHRRGNWEQDQLEH